jgi:hypothetical protein
MSGGGEDSTSQGERWGCGSNDDMKGVVKTVQAKVRGGDVVVMMMRVGGMVKTVQAKVRGEVARMVMMI